MIKLNSVFVFFRKIPTGFGLWVLIFFGKFFIVAIFVPIYFLIIFFEDRFILKNILFDSNYLVIYGEKISLEGSWRKLNLSGYVILSQL